MIKAVIFDVGGVLLRTEDYSGRIKWEQRLGLKQGALDDIVFKSEEAIRAGLGLANKVDVWNGVGQRFGLAGQDLQQMEMDFWSGDRIDEALLEYARSLRGKYSTAILSNAWPEARRMLEVKYQVTPAFDMIIISAEEKIAKPDIRIFQLAASRLGVNPEECIFVDDFQENILGARQARMVAVQFFNTPQVISEVNKVLSVG